MKRGAVILVVVFGLGTAMGILSYCFFRDRISSADWLRKEFSLNEKQSARILALNAEYGPQCKEMCARIARADSRLAGLIDSSRIVTQEIREALVETDRVRSECRLKMMEHCYEVATAMPEEKRGKYIVMILPVILDPGRMAEAHEID